MAETEARAKKLLEESENKITEDRKKMLEEAKREHSRKYRPLAVEKCFVRRWMVRKEGTHRTESELRYAALDTINTQAPSWTLNGSRQRGGGKKRRAFSYGYRDGVRRRNCRKDRS